MNATGPMETVIEAVRSGRMLVLCDDSERDSDGDVVLAAEKVSADSVNFMAKHCRGIICLALDSETCERLDFPLMNGRQPPAPCEAFTVSIEAREGITTGISAADRACTIFATVSPDARPEDFVRPGHIFPIRAKDGGVLSRAGRVEAAIDVMRLAGLRPAAVICKILDGEGRVAGMPHLRQFALEHGMSMFSVADLISFRLRTESFAQRGAETDLLTPYGAFKVVPFTNTLDKRTHLALIKGELSPEKEILVRVHSECLAGDVFSSRACMCGDRLRRAMSIVAEEGLGIILYLRNAPEPPYLCSRVAASLDASGAGDACQRNGTSTQYGSLVDYGVCAQMLAKLDVRKVRVLTDNPRKIVAVKGYNFAIVEEVPLK